MVLEETSNASSAFTLNFPNVGEVRPLAWFLGTDAYDIGNMVISSNGEPQNYHGVNLSRCGKPMVSVRK